MPAYASFPAKKNNEPKPSKKPQIANVFAEIAFLFYAIFFVQKNVKKDNEYSKQDAAPGQKLFRRIREWCRVEKHYGFSS